MLSLYYHVVSVPIAKRKFIINNTLRRWLYLEGPFQVAQVFEKFVPSHRTMNSKSRRKKSKVHFLTIQKITAMAAIIRALSTR